MNEERVKRMVRELYADPTSELFRLIEAIPLPEDRDPPAPMSGLEVPA